MKELRDFDKKAMEFLNEKKDWSTCKEIANALEVFFDDVYGELDLDQRKNLVYKSMDLLGKRGFIEKDRKRQGYHDKEFVFYLLDFEKYEDYLEDLEDLKNSEDVPTGERMTLTNMIIEIIRERIISNQQDFEQFSNLFGQSLRQKNREAELSSLIDKLIFEGFLDEKEERKIVPREPIWPSLNPREKKESEEYDKFIRAIK